MHTSSTKPINFRWKILNELWSSWKSWKLMGMRIYYVLYTVRNRIAWHFVPERKKEKERDRKRERGDVDLKVSKLDALEHVTCKPYEEMDEYYERITYTYLFGKMEKRTKAHDRTSRIVKYAIFMIFNGVNRHKIQLWNMYIRHKPYRHST